MAEMTQQNAPVTEAPAPAAPTARPSGTSNQKKKQRKKVRNTIIALVVLAVLAVGGFLAGKLYPDMDEELRRRQRRAP